MLRIIQIIQKRGIDMGDTERTKKSSKGIVVIFILLLVIIALLVYIAFFRNKASEVENNGDEISASSGIGEGESYIIDESNFERINKEIQEKTSEGMFATYMNMYWNFPDSSSPSSNAVIGNDPSNIKPIYFEIKLENGDIVYKSAILPVGSMLKEIKLNKSVPKGVYKAFCIYHLMDEKDGKFEEFSNVQFEITIEIEN